MEHTTHQTPKVNVWTRIITVGTEQVLLYKEFNNEDEDSPYRLNAIIQDNGLIISVGLSYRNEEDRDESFDTYTEEKAHSLLKCFVGLAN